MMKKIKIYCFLIFTIGLLFASLSFSSISLPSSSTSHSQIFINGNTQLDAFCAGNGTDGLSWETAHVIENYEITASSQWGFCIINTDLYLIIRNCEIRCNVLNYEAFYADVCENINITGCELIGEGGGNSNGCVYFGNCQFVYVCDSDIRDAAVGVDMGGDNNITITRNTFSTASYGIQVRHSDSNAISYNTGNTNGSYGIFLDSECDDNEVFSNCFEGGGSFLGIVNEREGNNIHDNGCRPRIPGYSLGIVIASVVGITTVILALTKKRSKK